MMLPLTAFGWTSSTLARLGFLGIITSCTASRTRCRAQTGSDFSIPLPGSCFISEVAARDFVVWRRAHASSIHEVQHTVREAVAFCGQTPLLACLSFQPSVLVPDNVKANSPCDAMQILLPTPHNLAPCFHVLLRYCTSLFSRVGAMHKLCAEAQPGRGCYGSATNLQGCTRDAMFM